jgi:hypothetical protein
MRKVDLGNAKRLAAAGILSLGVGAYSLMAGSYPCGATTFVYCSGVCYADNGVANCVMFTNPNSHVCGCADGHNITIPGS